jgi:hypothetical protein
VYSALTLETADKLAVFITDAPAKCTSAIYPLWKSDRSPILQYFHMNCSASNRNESREYFLGVNAASA